MNSRVFFFFLRLYLFIFRERGREGEREGEKHQCVVASHAPLLGTWSATQTCVLTGNQTSDPLVRRPVLNPQSYTSQGQVILIITKACGMGRQHLEKVKQHRIKDV